MGGARRKGDGGGIRGKLNVHDVAEGNEESIAESPSQVVFEQIAIERLRGRVKHERQREVEEFSGGVVVRLES